MNIDKTEETQDVMLKLLVSVIQSVDGTVHRINLYPLDNSIGFGSSYPMDSDLSSG